MCGIRVAEVLKHVLGAVMMTLCLSVGYEHVVMDLVSQLESGTSTTILHSLHKTVSNKAGFEDLILSSGGTNLRVKSVRRLKCNTFFNALICHFFLAQEEAAYLQCLGSLVCIMRILAPQLAVQVLEFEHLAGLAQKRRRGGFTNVESEQTYSMHDQERLSRRSFRDICIGLSGPMSWLVVSLEHWYEAGSFPDAFF
ncbi:hypothetical protein Tco_0667459 [Tanacetum coccineum]